MLSKKALFISGFVGVVALGSSIGAYASLRGNDDPADTTVNFEVAGPGSDASQTRLSGSNPSKHPYDLIGEDAVDPSLGVPAPGFEGLVDETIVIDGADSTTNEGGELSLGVPAPGFEGIIDELIVIYDPDNLDDESEGKHLGVPVQDFEDKVDETSVKPRS